MKRWILLAVSLGLLGGLIGWRVTKKQAEARAQTQQREMRAKMAPLVQVAPAVVRDIVHTFESIGSVEAPLNVRIAPKVTGRIDYLHVLEGDRVTAGQVLVRVDPTEIQAQVAQQQAAVAEAEHRLAQARLTQNPTDVGVNTQIKQQVAAVASAQADFKQVRANYTSQVAAAESSVTDAQGKVNSAKAGVANAEAGLRSAQANLNNAQAKLNRENELYKQGFVAAQDVDDAQTAVSVQNAAVDVAKSQINAAQAQLDSANAQLLSAQKQLDITEATGKASIEASRAKLVQAQASLENARANLAQKPAYLANLAALQASVDAARAMLRNAQAQRANTVLAAPLNGFVTARYMDPGSMATPGQPILAIQAIKQIWVTVPVPEEESRKIGLGQAATVTLDALPGRTLIGKVTQFNPSADPLSRQFSVRVTLDNPHSLIKPGMFAHVVMETERVPGAIVVPREAIQQGPDGTSVTVVSDLDVAERRPVTTGAQDADGVAITDGIRAGEKVIVLSAMPIRDGQAVRLAGGKPGGRGRRGMDSRP